LNLPAFTAQTSLYRTRGCYRAKASCPREFAAIRLQMPVGCQCESSESCCCKIAWKGNEFTSCCDNSGCQSGYWVKTGPGWSVPFWDTWSNTSTCWTRTVRRSWNVNSKYAWIFCRSVAAQGNSSLPKHRPFCTIQHANISGARFRLLAWRPGYQTINDLWNSNSNKWRRVQYLRYELRSTRSKNLRLLEDLL